MSLFHLRTRGISTIGQLVVAFFKYLPYILIIVLLKLFLIMVIFSGNNRDNNYASFNDYNPSVEDPVIDEALLGKAVALAEKQKVLAKLNDTILVATNLNRTPHDSGWLFFNRIPRTGGQSLVSLLKVLGPHHEYEHQEHTYRTPWQRLLTEEEKKNLAIWFEYNLWTRSYDRFAPFVDFTKYRSSYVHTRPIYVTLVRDPVEKFVSNFRFRRMDPSITKREMAKREKNTTGLGRKWYWRTIDECILEGDPECDLRDGQSSFVSSVSFLCGQEEQCLKLNDRWALQKAKYNAEYEYSVVGVLEHWNRTLSVMEQYIPLFFKGALNIYYSKDYTDEQRKDNHNGKRFQPMSDKVSQTLKNMLATEYELYEFLNQRLHRQFEAIENRMKSTTKLPDLQKPPRQLSPLERFQIELRQSAT